LQVLASGLGFDARPLSPCAKLLRAGWRLSRTAVSRSVDSRAGKKFNSLRLTGKQPTQEKSMKTEFFYFTPASVGAFLMCMGLTNLSPSAISAYAEGRAGRNVQRRNQDLFHEHGRAQRLAQTRPR
jgi:hypothetical protein